MESLVVGRRPIREWDGLALWIEGSSVVTGSEVAAGTAKMLRVNSGMMRKPSIKLKWLSSKVRPSIWSCVDSRWGYRFSPVGLLGKWRFPPPGKLIEKTIWRRWSTPFGRLPFSVAINAAFYISSSFILIFKFFTHVIKHINFSVSKEGFDVIQVTNLKNAIAVSLDSVTRARVRQLNGVNLLTSDGQP